MSGQSSTAAARRSLVDQFFYWWAQELWGQAPVRRQSLSSSLFVSVEDVSGAAHLRRGRNGERHRQVPLQPVGENQSALGPPPKRGPVLELEESAVLVRRLSFPRAVESKLDAVLRYEFAARMPFELDDVYYDYQIVDRKPDTLTVDLICAERARVDALRWRLAGVGLEPGSVTVANTRVDLLRSTSSGGGRSPWAGVTTAVLALFSLGLGAAVLWLPLERQREAVQTLSQEVEVARARAEETRDLVDAAEAAAQRATDLRAALDVSTPRVALINAAAEALPDSAWLTSLTLEGETVRLSGQAEAAPPLIRLLAASPHFAEPEFAAPVVRDVAGGVERFEIVARIEKEAAE